MHRQRPALRTTDPRHREREWPSHREHGLSVEWREASCSPERRENGRADHSSNLIAGWGPPRTYSLKTIARSEGSAYPSAYAQAVVLSDGPTAPVLHEETRQAGWLVDG